VHFRPEYASDGLDAGSPRSSSCMQQASRRKTALGASAGRTGGGPGLKWEPSGESHVQKGELLGTRENQPALEYRAAKNGRISSCSPAATRRARLRRKGQRPYFCGS
jgi:hypothetical protein